MQEYEEESLAKFIKDREEWVKWFLPEFCREATFGTFKATTPESRAARDAARDWADRVFYGDRRPLVLYGPPGGGKTSLACCAWNVLAPAVPDRSSYSAVQACTTADNVAFVRGSKLPDIIKTASRPANEGTQVLTCEHVSTCYFCILDDLDKCPAGAWSASLLQIINDRLCRFRHPTIITMNTTPAELALKHGESGPPLLNRLVRTGSVFVRVPKYDGASAPAPGEEGGIPPAEDYDVGFVPAPGEEGGIPPAEEPEDSMTEAGTD